MAVIVKIRAGLGNQMFQYAVGRSLANKLNTQLFLHTWGFDIDPFRKYELERFNISPQYLSSEMLKQMKEVQRRRYLPIRKFLEVVRSRFTPLLMVDAECGFDERLMKTWGNVYLDGFWQSEKYFKNIRPLLLKEFTFRNTPSPSNSKYLAEIASQNAICIHLRRGDYLNEELVSKHGVCSLDYYSEAISYIHKKIDKPVFYIFSDDPEWVHLNFPVVKPMTIISHNVGKDDPEDLRLMMACRHFIIANSSFSWWAAWLAQFPGKTVVAPKIWFSDANRSGRDMVPEDWIQF